MMIEEGVLVFSKKLFQSFVGIRGYKAYEELMSVNTKRYLRERKKGELIKFEFIEKLEAPYGKVYFKYRMEYEKHPDYNNTMEIPPFHSRVMIDYNTMEIPPFNSRIPIVHSTMEIPPFDSRMLAAHSRMEIPPFASNLPSKKCDWEKEGF